MPQHAETSALLRYFQEFHHAGGRVYLTASHMGPCVSRLAAAGPKDFFVSLQPQIGFKGAAFILNMQIGFC